MSYSTLYGPRPRLLSTADPGVNLFLVNDLTEACRLLLALRGARLAKMAIADNKPGEEVVVVPRSTDRHGNTIVGHGASTVGIPRVFGYDHLLKPEARAAGYRLFVHQTGDALHAKVLAGPQISAGSGQYVGGVTGHKFGNQLGIERADVSTNHRDNGMKLGTSAMEALMTHAYHHLDCRQVYGGTHSSSAHAVHQKLAQKHKLSYRGRANYPEKGSGFYDDKYKPYRYKLK